MNFIFCSVDFQWEQNIYTYLMWRKFGLGYLMMLYLNTLTCMLFWSYNYLKILFVYSGVPMLLVWLGWQSSLTTGVDLKAL